MSGDPQEPGDYDDEGREEFSERLDALVMASQGFLPLHGALDDVWDFVFGEPYPHHKNYSEE